MELEIYQVDSFTKEIFKGNPAGVCILNKPISDKLMQKIAMEMNLSETAFLIYNDSKKTNIYDLRWFTPKHEVPICGHGTLAAAGILFKEFNIPYKEIIFKTKSGDLFAKLYKDKISLDFPLDSPEFKKLKTEKRILEALGIQNYKNIFIGQNTKKLVIHLENYNDILNLKPNFDLLKNIEEKEIKGIGITAKKDNEYDFISRYFNPWAGVNEDSVTGSVHTLLGNYWSELLNKKELKSYQASERGGEIFLKIINKKRIELMGNFVITLKGKLIINL